MPGTRHHATTGQPAIPTLTTRDVATRLICTPRKVSQTAREHGIGYDRGGRAGFRFTEADVTRLYTLIYRPVSA